MIIKLIDNSIKNEKKYLGISHYIFCFFIFSFIGWIIETLFCYLLLGEFIKRGFLYSPICPIYGTGAFILTAYLDKVDKKNNYFSLFLMFTIIFSFFEYLVGFVLDALFAARWWDYSDSKYNLNGRITLLNSFFWGIMTILFTRFVYPLIQKFRKFLVSKISSTVQIIISCVLVSGIIVDFVLSCVKYLG